MTKTTKDIKHQTFKLTDTVDAYSRRLHINELNGKVTMVFRWKDKSSHKKHTQRTTVPVELALQIANQLWVTSLYCRRRQAEEMFGYEED